nr:immunoglobulin light chain junction region [Macaca mulatta]MOV77583.1 immunoglobulin light chain junction region [Macaca mulatta]MOV78024.1 immunoglobulin light chain junction region [Macaca mulatta]MOV78049.1 immunoglobulin light chain junction region [Macaca mulatta]MOV79746.1 immunoglobulin light chain junction region [Macaca mulatta]
CQQYNSLPRTF